MSSFTATGKLIRMNHIFREDGKAAMVAINHGLALGPAKGIAQVMPLIEQLMPERPDSFTIHRGIAKICVDAFGGRAGLVLKSTNTTRFFAPQETPVAQVIDAVALGADAISVGLSMCDPHEEATVEHIGRVISEAEEYGMPTVAHAYPNGSLISDDARYQVENVSYAVRVALELGIDIIKTFWTGDRKSFEQIVAMGSPAKVVISGGARCDTLRDCYTMTWQGIQAGASGITYGRNIWQHEYPAAVLRGLVEIIHNDASVDQALEAACEKAGTKLN